MNKLVVLLLLLATSCNTKSVTEKGAWEALLVDFEVEKANEFFNILIERYPKKKKNYLGLAYTQCILNKENWLETLRKFAEREEDLWKYGHFATTFRTYLGDKELKTEFDIDEFRALHLDRKFKIEKDFQIIEGEYKDLKPHGIWKFYKLNGEFIRHELKYPM